MPQERHTCCGSALDIQCRHCEQVLQLRLPTEHRESHRHVDSNQSQTVVHPAEGHLRLDEGTGSSLIGMGRVGCIEHSSRCATLPHPEHCMSECSTLRGKLLASIIHKYDCVNVFHRTYGLFTAASLVAHAQHGLEHLPFSVSCHNHRASQSNPTSNRSHEVYQKMNEIKVDRRRKER